MTSNGTQTFTWNPRGQLAQITGGSVPASFVYDATGRRRQATFNATTTSFLNDGPNLAQDLQAGSAVATHLNGLAVDSTAATTTSGGTQARLPDALGSTVALTDASGSVVTDYTHDPYGTPATLGAATSNRIGYAGREIDPTGLSYNRNRYYNPAIGRFTSEDPIGMNGGQTNRMAYVGNDPFGFRDPYGLNAIGDFGHWVSNTGDNIGNRIGDGFGWADDNLREPFGDFLVSCGGGAKDYFGQGFAPIVSDYLKGAAEGAAVGALGGGAGAGPGAVVGAIEGVAAGAVFSCIRRAVPAVSKSDGAPPDFLDALQNTPWDLIRASGGGRRL